MNETLSRKEAVKKAMMTLAHTSQLERRSVTDRLVPAIGLHRGACVMLIHLRYWEDGAPSQRELAEHLDVSPACVARALKALMSEGYVSRTGDELDSRTNRLELTELGREAAERGQAVFEDFYDWIMEDFTDEQVQTFHSMIMRMEERLLTVDARTLAREAHDQEASES